MSGGPPGIDLQRTSCPVCGHVSAISAAETLRPTICSNCQQLHVATLSVTSTNANVSDTAISPALQLPKGVKKILGEIARYLVIEVLGSGSFGVVYKAWDPSLRRWVAIKVPTIRQRKEASVEAFLREAQSAARMRHPRIVSIYDVDQLNGNPYIVSEYVEGVTLAKHLTAGAMPVRKALRFIGELAAALHYAHRQGVVHRDIKPSNIMMDSQGRPRLMDFGLAQQLSEASTVSEGDLVGTLAYMSPEQGRGAHSSVGPASDQYSLGLVFFECLTGRRLREGPATAVLAQIAAPPVHPLREALPSLSATVEQICDRMMSAKIDDRYPDLNRVAAELVLLLKADTPSAATPLTSSARFSRSVLLVAMASVGIVPLTMVLVALFWKAPPAASTSQGIVQGPAVSVPGKPPDEVPPDEIPDAPPIPPVMDTPKIPDDLSSPELLVDNDDPVNALDAIADARIALEIEENLADGKQSFPAVDLTAEQRQLIETLLTLGLPGRSRELASAGIIASEGTNQVVKSGRVTDEAFQKVSSIEKALRSSGVRDPRLPFAMAMIRKHYVPSPNARSQGAIPETGDFLEQARLQQDAFLPQAYMSLVHLKLTSSDTSRKGQIANHQAAYTIMSEAVQRLHQNASWPDRSERKRVAIWLGRVHAYFASGINGLGRDLKDDSLESVRNAFFSSQQETLTSALPEDLRGTFQTSFIDSQLQIADAIAGVNAEKADLIRKAAGENDQKVQEAIARQGEEAASKAAIGQAKEQLVATYNQQIKEIEARLIPLKNKWEELQRQAAERLPHFTAAQARYDLAFNKKALLDTQRAAGTLVNEAEYQTAEQELNISLTLLKPIVTEMESLNKRTLEINRMGAQLQQQWLGTMNAAKVVHVQLDRQAQDVEKRLSALANGTKKIAADGVQTKKPADTRVQRTLSQFERWTQWTDEDAEVWLIQSLKRVD